ncbi:MAG: BREX protein BrxB domain-containing protein [Candidatus Limnocylindrales bacterium]
MERVEALITEYRRQLSLPWRADLSGPERVWMAVYPPDLERRVRARLADFEFATRESGHGWRVHDITTAFSRWLAEQEYRDAYYRDPDALAPALPRFLAGLEAELRATLEGADAGQSAVVALVGVGALFPMVRVSDLLQHVADRIQGRLLVLFPGSLERGNYRLLDARDGWNYLAIPITIPEGASR